MNAFPANITTITDPNHDHEQQVDEICELFSSTIHSLAADAVAIRQISSLADVSGISASATSTGTASSINSNINFGEPSLQQLIQIDELVTKLEEKVTALRTIVSEEKTALDKFETKLHQEATSQEHLIEQMSEAMVQLGVLQERNLDDSNNYSSGGGNQARSSSNNKKSGKGSRKSKSGRRRDSVDPRSMMMRTPSSEEDEDHQEVSLERVTAAELRQMPRQTLGRISLLDLNEALQEIENVCHKKMKAMPRKKKNHHGMPSSSSHTLQRRYDYLKQQRANDGDVEVEAHAGHVWVSEQELRENCAFFRLGERSARSTLTILCALHRLKQVPGRHTEITYICLTNNNDDGSEGQKSDSQSR